MFLVWMDYWCLEDMEWETVFVTREAVNMMDVLRWVTTEGWCCIKSEGFGFGQMIAARLRV